jgi:hypothetical protein
MRPAIQIIVQPAGRDCFRATVGERLLAGVVTPGSCFRGLDRAGSSVRPQPKVSSPECSFAQTNRITLPKPYRVNYSFGHYFAYHLGLVGVPQLFASSLQYSGHHRNCLGSERPK